ncbi:MAG: hypothetical protein KatS3mg128_0246 [Silanimonas sp.]|nr:MAG: hypothetical protein KatS3mg128_0246 [Silanimonas sp.]
MRTSTAARLACCGPIWPGAEDEAEALLEGPFSEASETTIAAIGELRRAAAPGAVSIGARFDAV